MQDIDQEKTFAIYIPDKELEFIIYEEFLQHKNKKNN